MSNSYVHYLDVYPYGVYTVRKSTLKGGQDGMRKEEHVSAEDDICCCSEKHKERDEKEVRDLMNRLKRIEGQVRGIEKMVEKGAYCTDILTQVSAVNKALNSFNKVLLANHVRTCVAENIRNGNDEIIDELVSLLQKLMK